jgi:hypothetical protein
MLRLALYRLGRLRTVFSDDFLEVDLLARWTTFSEGLMKTAIPPILACFGRYLGIYKRFRMETTGIECFHSVARIPHFLGISHIERSSNEGKGVIEPLVKLLVNLLADGRQNTIVMLFIVVYLRKELPTRSSAIAAPTHSLEQSAWDTTDRSIDLARFTTNSKGNYCFCLNGNERVLHG